jgi:putative phosphoesterase
MISEHTIIAPKTTISEPSKIVGLISDTHVPSRAKRIPKMVFKTFEKADYIIHAGDIVELSVIDELEELAPVLAVHGNMDRQKVSGALPKINSLKVFAWKIGVMHDPNTPFGRRRIREIASQNRFDVFVYGHTHSSKIKWEGKRLYINPGSPTDPDRPYMNKPSVGLLTITKKEIKPEIVFF